MPGGRRHPTEITHKKKKKNVAANSFGVLIFVVHMLFPHMGLWEPIYSACSACKDQINFELKLVLDAFYVKSKVIERDFSGTNW